MDEAVDPDKTRTAKVTAPGPDHGSWPMEAGPTDQPERADGEDAAAAGQGSPPPDDPTRIGRYRVIRRAWPGGIRPGLPGSRRRPRPRRGHQGAQSRAHRRPRRPRGVPGRGARPSRCSTTRTSSRSTTWAASTTGNATSSPSTSRAATWPGGSGGAADVSRIGRACGGGRRGAASCAHPRPGASRPEAREHLARCSGSSPASPISAWPCGTRTMARGPDSPAPPRT